MRYQWNACVGAGISSVVSISTSVVLLNGFVLVPFRERKQISWSNLLLMIATIAAASIWLFWSQQPEATRFSVFKDQPITMRADYLQSYLSLMSALKFVDEDFPESKFLPTVKSREQYRELCLHSIEDYLGKLAAYYPHNLAFIVRLCLVAAEAGDNPCEQMHKYVVEDEDSETLHTFTRVFCADKHLSSEDKLNVLASVEKLLPPGWFRQSALMTAYRSFGDQSNYDQLLLSQKATAREMLLRWAAGYSSFLVVLLVGLFVVGRTAWHYVQKRVTPEKLESPLSFSLVYGIWLFHVYCSVIAALGADRLEEQLHLNWTPQLHNWSVLLMSDTLSLALLLLAIYVLLIRTRRISSFSDLLIIRQTDNKCKAARVAIYGFFAAFALALVVDLLLASCGQSNQSDTSMARNFRALALYPEPAAIAAASVVTTLVGPIGEELFYRGFLYRWLRKHLSPVAAMLISGLFFGVVHRDPTRLAQYSLIGVVLAIVYEQTGSLWASIVAHILYNVNSNLLLFVLL